MQTQKLSSDNATHVIAVIIFLGIIIGLGALVVYGIWWVFHSETIVWNQKLPFSVLGYTPDFNIMFGLTGTLSSVGATAMLVRHRLGKFWMGLSVVASLVAGFFLIGANQVILAGVLIIIPVLSYIGTMIKPNEERAKSKHPKSNIDGPWGKLITVGILAVVAAYNPIYSSPTIFLAVATGGHVSWWLTMLFTKRGQKDKEMVQYVEPIAKQMGMKTPTIILADDRSYLNAAAFWSLKGYLLVFPRLFETMNADEFAAIIGHELAHLKYKHNIISISALIGIVGFGMFLAPQYGIPIWAYIVVAAISSMYVGKLLEMHADRIACKYVGGENFASAMQTLQEALRIKETGGTRLNLYLPATHPPFSYRIEKSKSVPTTLRFAYMVPWPPLGFEGQLTLPYH